MNANVNELLKQLDNINQQALIDIYLPSLKRHVKFKNLTLKQQKNLLKSSIDESLTKLSFNTIFYNIVKENNTESIDINTLTTIDRNIIALALRAVGIDSSYKTDEKTVNLHDLIANIPSIQLENLETVIAGDSIDVCIAAPTLKSDYELSNYALNKLKQQGTDLKSVIGELFIYELLKFIKSVTLKTGETPTEILFSTIRIEDRVAIAEKFASTTTNSILDFIKAYRVQELRFNKINDITIDIDGSFFTI